MDTFFSLFDPSDSSSKNTKKHRRDSSQDNVKKKTDTAKGRRRGRKGQGKNETLPEESSFLCEPDLSNEILVKDGSYIENYFESNTADVTESKEDPKKPKRKPSTRKNRRKKNKISPAKDLPQLQAWLPPEPEETLNNKQNNFRRRNSVENLGKNVNKLRTEDNKKNGKASDGKKKLSCEANNLKQIHNVIDKLNNFNYKNDNCKLDDWCMDDLEDYASYSGEDDVCDDSSSELDDSSDETYGSLPPEPRFGNVEYKLQLVSPCERRFQHLVTQLKWRVASGGGAAVYVVGVRDGGALRGLRARALLASLRTLRLMAEQLPAKATLAAARKLPSGRAVAEVHIRKCAETQKSVELRIAVMGANEAGKSTLIGVLTQGELDNGRGSARLNMFRHVHEVRSGRTSSLSHEILGFDSRGNVVNYGCSELMTAERIGARSAKLVSFLDLAGHSKYQRTTVRGLSGYSPHHAMLVISSTAGITNITEEHIDFLLALDMPFFTVVSKCELATKGVEPIVEALAVILAKHNRKPLLITDENLARNCVRPQKLILDCVDGLAEEERGTENVDDVTQQVPVFPVSCVKGLGLSSLHAYLLALEPPVVETRPKPEEESCEFQIDEIFHVCESVGPIVGGLLVNGKVREGDKLLIGPLESCDFEEITVKSIYRNRVPCDEVKAGQSASLGLSHYPQTLRQGMVLLAIPENYKITKPLTLGACPPGKCMNSRDKFIKILTDTQRSEKKYKRQRKRVKNLLKDLNCVVEVLEKSPTKELESNLYVSDESEVEKGGECKCSEVLVEDPDNPRGCFYFEANIHLLRHSSEYIAPGFQCTVHIGNVRQTAIIEAIQSTEGVLRSGQSARALFRFLARGELIRAHRRLLLRAGAAAAAGTTSRVFPAPR